MNGTNAVRKSEDSMCRVAMSNSCYTCSLSVQSTNRTQAQDTHLPRGNVLWGTVAQEPDTGFGKDVEIVADIIDGTP